MATTGPVGAAPAEQRGWASRLFGALRMGARGIWLLLSVLFLALGLLLRGAGKGLTSAGGWRFGGKKKA